jgi:hypothetical protein
MCRNVISGDVEVLPQVSTVLERVSGVLRLASFCVCMSREDIGFFALAVWLMPMSA